MKKNILFYALIVSIMFAVPSAFAEDQTDAAHTTWHLGLSSLQWNEEIILAQGGSIELETANYSGISMALKKIMPLNSNWDWKAEVFLGAGQANAGRNNTMNYKKEKENFTIFGAIPGVFYNLSEQIKLGTSALIYLRNIDLSALSPNTSATAVQNVMLTAAVDLNLRISENFEFNQVVAPLKSGATFWNLGIGYKF